MSDHEIRVALVLNGGVSLAVWMGGVVHELDLLRRASAGPEAPDPQPYDAEISARWAELCQHGGESRRVVVDVIAGTSAGGLNGSMLATAIAHGSSLDPPDVVPGPWLRQRWSALGGLEPDALIPASTQPASVLDGGYFLDQLQEILGTLAGAGEPAAAGPVTLFVTASGLGRQMFQAQDAAGQPFHVPDHRYLFRFTSEERSQYKGDGATFESVTANELANTSLLALASRASASFPAAFVPVLELPDMTETPPRVQPTWPHPPSYLVDGGVLDNAPFGPVLDVVARRPVAGKSSRYVLYVVPSSGIGTASTQVQQASAPSWRTAVLSAVQFPREVDFRSDVEQLERLLMEADASWSDTQRLFDRSVDHPDEQQRLLQAAELLRPAYVRGRAAGGVWEALTISNGAGSTVLDATSALSEPDVSAIIAAAPAWVLTNDLLPLSTDVIEEVVTNDTGTAIDGSRRPLWPWGTGPAERVVRLVLRDLRTRIDDATAANPVELTALVAALDDTSGVLQRVIAVRDAVAEALAGAQLDAVEGVVAVTAGVNHVFETLDVRAALGAQVAQLETIVPPEQVLTALAVEITSRCTSARTPLQRSAPFKFLRLGPNVELPLLSDQTSGARAAMLADRILYGTQVGHFGAFGASEWREWDWLMGRLHGVAHLAHLLGADEEWIREQQALVLASEGYTLDDVNKRIDHLFDSFLPGAGMAALTAMRDELNATPPGRVVLTAVVDRLVAVSGGVNEHLGDLVKALAAVEHRPKQWYLRWVRWVTAPAREVFWRGIVSGVQQEQTPAPAVFAPWLVVGAALLATVLTALARVVDAERVSFALALAAGFVLAVTVALLVLWRGARWVRERLKKLCQRVLPPVPESPTPDGGPAGQGAAG